MYRNIIVPVDTFEESSWKSVVPVLEAYFSGKQDSCIHLVSVYPEDKALSIYSQFIPDGFEEHIEEDIKSKLEQIENKINKPGVVVKKCLLKGIVYVELLNYIEKVKGDLVILSSHRPELKDYLIGPVASRVLRHSNCSVLVCR